MESAFSSWEVSANMEALSPWCGQCHPLGGLGDAPPPAQVPLGLCLTLTQQVLSGASGRTQVIDMIKKKKCIPRLGLYHSRET